MPKKPSRRGSCEGKAEHATKALATDHQMSLIRSGARNLRVYKCRFCKKFHVGHPPKGGKP